MIALNGWAGRVRVDAALAAALTSHPEKIVALSEHALPVVWRIDVGDCLTRMRALPDCCIDALVTDPPAGIAFMGKTWDSDKGGRAQWIAWLTAIMRECYRVMKPGAHGAVWALPRTSHWTATALEDAGFELRDCGTHLFGSGFPKSLNVAKAIDRAGGTPQARQARELRARREAAGMSREEVAEAVGCTAASVRDWEDGRARAKGRPKEWIVPSPEYRATLAELFGYSEDERVVVGEAGDRRGDGSVAALGHSGVLREGGNTPEASAHKGLGTALKPASEHWWLIRKPLEGTVAANVSKHGTGALNVDGCRVASDGSHMVPTVKGRSGGMTAGDDRVGAALGMFEAGKGFEPTNHPGGRWPPNLLLTHSASCVRVGERKVATGTTHEPAGDVVRVGATDFLRSSTSLGRTVGFADADGTETIPAYACAADCPVRVLDEQSGELTTGRLLTHHKRGGQSQIGTFNIRDRTGEPCDFGGDTGGCSRFFPTFEWTEEDFAGHVTTCPVSSKATAPCAPSRSLTSRAAVDGSAPELAETSRDARSSSANAAASPSPRRGTTTAPSRAAISLHHEVKPFANTISPGSSAIAVSSLSDCDIGTERTPSFATGAKCARSPTAPSQSEGRANNAARRSPIVTTTTTPSRSTFDGSVGRAIPGTTSPSLAGGAPVFHVDLVEPLFRYCAKPSTAERDAGLAHRVKKRATSKVNRANGTGERFDGAETATRANSHPTVKAIALMRWLVRLVTPKGGLVLDPFAGSGTTIVAALREGMRAYGIELDPEHVSIARDRVVGDAPLLNRVEVYP